MKTFRTATINILNSGDESEALTRYRYCAEAIRSNRPDVIFFQELTFPDLLFDLLDGEGYNFLLGGSRKNRWDLENRLAIGSLSGIDLPDGEIQGKYPGILCEAITSIQGQKIHLLNCHMPWGAHRESERLKMAGELEKFSQLRENSVDLSILAGDFNSDPDSRTIRFLRGKDMDLEGGSTFWVDCGEESRERSIQWTSDHAVNPLGRRTAKNLGIELPELLKRRRIDYIFAKGWVYGRLGSPIKSRYFRNPEKKIFTDHEPIMVDHFLSMDEN